MKIKTSNRNWNKNQQILLLEKDYAPKTLTVCNDDTARMHAEKKNSHAGSNGYFYVSQVMSYKSSRGVSSGDTYPHEEHSCFSNLMFCQLFFIPPYLLINRASLIPFHDSVLTSKKEDNHSVSLNLLS